MRYKYKYKIILAAPWSLDVDIHPVSKEIQYTKIQIGSQIQIQIQIMRSEWQAQVGGHSPRPTDIDSRRHCCLYVPAILGINTNTHKIQIKNKHKYKYKNLN